MDVVGVLLLLMIDWDGLGRRGEERKGGKILYIYFIL